MSFNPRICKRCDKKTKGIKRKGKVSIHASVKDATAYGEKGDEILKFQSTHL